MTKSHSSILFRIYNHSFTQNPSRSILGETERKEKGKICYLALSTFSIQIIAAQYFSWKNPFPLSSFGCSILMKIQFGSLLSFFPPQFVHFHPLKVISDLWVSFPGRMITVFYGGGERSSAPHQGWSPLVNDWAGRADRSTAVPLQIQAVALHHRRKDDSLYLSLASYFPLCSLYHSFL